MEVHLTPLRPFSFDLQARAAAVFTPVLLGFPAELHERDRLRDGFADRKILHLVKRRASPGATEAEQAADDPLDPLRLLEDQPEPSPDCFGIGLDCQILSHACDSGQWIAHLMRYSRRQPSDRGNPILMGYLSREGFALAQGLHQDRQSAAGSTGK